MGDHLQSWGRRAGGALLAVILSACGDDGTGMGPGADGGGPVADAGPDLDAGPRLDSGPRPDVGPHREAGPHRDTGTSDARRREAGEDPSDGGRDATAAVDGGGSDGAADAGVDGSSGECAVDCDCPQGQACAGGACVELRDPIYCCDRPGCPEGDRCVTTGGTVSMCAECVVDCDCPQGMLCTASGLCVTGVEPSYCCGRAGCPEGEACTDPGGASGVCDPDDLCGNGELDPGEECDGDCPTAPEDCDDERACTVDSLEGSPDACTARCQHATVEQCVDGDGCCPSACSASTDDDCSASMGDVGEPCMSPDDCDDVCVVNFTGGYCSAACSTDADCPGGSHCGLDGGEPAFCVRNCEEHADCREPEYGCHDQDGDARNECTPLGIGDGGIGAPCAETADCDGNERAVCYHPLQGFKDGYCSLRCGGSGQQCPAGSHCENDRCVLDCEDDMDCRADGYACYDASGNGSTECFPAATGDGAVGEPCEHLWDCSGGPDGACATEANGFPGGYCTRSCDFFFGTCPAGSHCAFDASFNGLCVDDCTADDECRMAEGYACYDAATEFGTEAAEECWPESD